jgi:hypothetical protein
VWEAASWEAASAANFSGLKPSPTSLGKIFALTWLRSRRYQNLSLVGQTAFAIIRKFPIHLLSGKFLETLTTLIKPFILLTFIPIVMQKIQT